jgi:hypothetical protein
MLRANEFLCCSLLLTLTGCLQSPSVSGSDAGVDAGQAFDAAGIVDSGSSPDAGANDAGTDSDAGVVPDAGSSIDAGAMDAGATADAGTMGDAGLPECGDGTTPTCPASGMATCSPPLVAAPYQGCTVCFDAMTCTRKCMMNADCDPGTDCLPDPNDPCNSTADCFRAGFSTCQACPPVTCDIFCTYGYQLDANGCETCSCNPGPCGCPSEVAQVCGTDGQTYANDCTARAAGATVAYARACGPECTMSECANADPVCGADGVTYNCGEAEAACHHTTVAYHRACGPVCEIDCLVYEPVCGADGVTYGCGEPDATCHHAVLAYRGPCTEACTTAADCASGDICQCPDPVSAPIPPEAGRGLCEPAGFCDTSADCTGPPPAGCVGGSWSCVQNTCVWMCG